MEHHHLISSEPRAGQEVKTAKGEGVGESVGSGEGCGVCAICLDKIALHEMALVKGCEHAYCVTCILRWATYNEIHTCPQCKHPFEFLNVHRSLDGSIQDYMFEESVCLLLRAHWFVSSSSIINTQDVEPQEESYNELEELLQTEVNQELDDIEQDESYYVSKASIPIGNRRWWDNGFTRTGRKEACPIARQYHDDAAEVGPSHGSKKEMPKDVTGRRAKRAMKREAANKAAVERHGSRPP
ncbi:uncharacterized protein LOC122017938 [Zingiber officinale]|uniref:RING-type domain-containing protein n=1 Tax=Zingiber officinale TaxID=94328 RepID=A0A8J5FE87_ZINOF|nr:uncharacterized protein LOC122008785 [Zingiber officinale]XP_042431595.1 uncharacterized protein LOC122017938 [Zingiber officinale]KAG6482456.1 hypothetical protein ZIOFF_059087 [Zingiber officinale]KAG6486339.1 hypothetical protein ZIOFF_054909 [Zingiber officinale]